MIVFKCSGCGKVLYRFPSDELPRWWGCRSVVEVVRCFMVCPECLRELRRVKVVVYG